MRRLLTALALLLQPFLSPAPGALAVPQEEEAARPDVVVIGSSVAAGWVTSREARHDLQNGWAARLQRLLARRGWTLVNASIPGDTTGKVLARIEHDLVDRHPRFAIIGLSMANEGLAQQETDAVFESYENGMFEILDICRENEIQPVVGLCYPSDNYSPEHYEAIERMNLELQGWSVPTIDFLGPLDDGTGHFVHGYTFDAGHPDDLGHREMFRAIVPSLFDALAAGKPAPERVTTEGQMTVEGPQPTAPLLFVPREVVHCFTVAFQIRCRNEGVIAEVDGGGPVLRVSVDDEGRLAASLGEGVLHSASKLTDGGWHEVALAHHHLRGETEVWLDGEPVGRLDGTLLPRLFAVGGPATSGAVTPPESADYRDLFLYRTALTARAVRAFHEGALLTASLEVYTPLRGAPPVHGTTIENLARSTSAFLFRPGDLSAARARLEARIEEEANEPRWIDPDEVEPIELDETVLARYVGDYEVNPQLTLFITLECGRLYLSPDGEGKTDLRPLSEKEFFLRVKDQPRIPVVFELDDEGTVTGLLLDEGEYQVKARRIR